VAVNVADEASVEAMFAEVVSRYGGFDLVVSNAGVLKAGSVKELSAEDFAFVTSVNYTGFFLVAKHAARIFEGAERRRRGSPPRNGRCTPISSRSIRRAASRGATRMGRTREASSAVLAWYRALPWSWWRTT
jgi:sorbitol-6-phosphate 2-dehydrogenase